MQVLLDYSNIAILQPPLRNYFTHDYKFGSVDGFQIAFGLTGYDGSMD